MHGVDYVFHAATLKQVLSCKLFPLKVVRTNFIGTVNFLIVAIELGVILTEGEIWRKFIVITFLWVTFAK